MGAGRCQVRAGLTGPGRCSRSPQPLPERTLTAGPEAIVDSALGGRGSPAAVFRREVRAAYVETLRDPMTPTPSARKTAPPRRSTASMTSRIVRGVVGSCVRSWPCGGRKGRSIPGTSRSPDRSRFGKPGATMFKDTGSTPATFSGRGSRTNCRGAGRLLRCRRIASVPAWRIVADLRARRS